MLRKTLVLLAMILPAAPSLAQDALAPAMTHSPLGYDVPAAPGTPASQIVRAAPEMSAEPGVIALSPEAREATLEAAAEHGGREISGGNGRAIHGEVGVMFGSHGTRAMYGTTVVPLGQTGTAAFSFMTGRDNLGYYRR